MRRMLEMRRDDQRRQAHLAPVGTGHNTALGPLSYSTMMPRLGFSWRSADKSAVGEQERNPQRAFF